MKKTILLLIAIICGGSAFCKSEPEWDRNFDKLVDGNEYTVYTKDEGFQQFPLQNFKKSDLPWVSCFIVDNGHYTKVPEFLKFIINYNVAIASRAKYFDHDKVSFVLGGKDMIKELKKDVRILGISVDPNDNSVMKKNK